jgi:hypothetical protein
MRLVCSSVLVLGLMAQGAMAQPSGGALPPGGSAGVPQARESIGTFWVASTGALLLGAGAYLISTQKSTTDSLVFSSNDNSVIPVNNTSVTSTTTSTH